MTLGADPADPSFGALLERLMVRAHLWDTTLAQRMGASRSEVFRWRTNRTRPSRKNLLRLEHALTWTSATGTSPLDAGERATLRTLAGHAALGLDVHSERRNRVELPDRCAVFAYQYGRRSFPSQWSRRSNEVEQEVSGTMHSMLHRPPLFLRPDSITRLYSKWYDGDLVERYIKELAERRTRWKERVSEYEVRHIYSKPQLAEYLRTRTWQGFTLTHAQVREHVYMLLDLLDAHAPNFQIGLDEDALPLDVTIVGHDVVLLTLAAANMVNAVGWTIFGMEMTGLSVVKTFSQGFDRTWGKRTVVKDPAAIRAWITEQIG